MASSSQSVSEMLADLGMECRVDADGVWASVPCTRRGFVAVRIVAAERTVTLRAFIMRNPDLGHQDVYRRLLRKNDETGVWAFSLDALGDVFLVATHPRIAVDPEVLDGLLGALSTLVDETFEGMVRTGFEIPPDVSVGPPPVGGWLNES